MHYQLLSFHISNNMILPGSSMYHRKRIQCYVYTWYKQVWIYICKSTASHTWLSNVCNKNRIPNHCLPSHIALITPSSFSYPISYDHGFFIHASIYLTSQQCLSITLHCG